MVVRIIWRSGFGEYMSTSVFDLQSLIPTRIACELWHAGDPVFWYQLSSVSAEPSLIDLYSHFWKW
jgi:hypothetical protein